MPVATHVLTGDFSALVGEVATIRATVHTNSADEGWVNDDDDEIRLGGALLTLNAAGEFTVTLPTSTGTGLQYQVSAEYVNADRQRKTWDSGWFDLTGNADLADKANDSTLRVNTTLGDVLAGNITALDTRVDALEAGGGTEALAARVDGYVDHGDVSGAVTFNGPTGSHWFDATAATTITLAGFAEGQVVSLLPFTGAADVTVTGLPDLELTDGLIASAMLARGAWVTGGGGGGEPATPDTTPPTAVTGLTATGGEGGLTASWTPATDAESTVRYRARVYLDGTTPPAWPTTGALYGLTSPSLTVTDLAAGSYRVQVHAYSSGGESAAATSAAVTVTTPLTVLLYDTFTRPGGSLIIDQPTPDIGPNWTAPGGSAASAQIIGGRLSPVATTCVAPLPSPATEISLDVDLTVGFHVEFGAFGVNFCKAKVKSNGQVELNGAGTTAIYNAAGGSNVYTPIGFITDQTYRARLSYDLTLGIAALYVDDVKIIEAPYTGAPTVNEVFVGAYDSIVDNVEAKG